MPQKPVGKKVDSALRHQPMPIKSFAVLAVLTSTALPISFLGFHAVREAGIPKCSSEMKSSAMICSEATTGLKYTVSKYKKIYG